MRAVGQNNLKEIWGLNNQTRETSLVRDDIPGSRNLGSRDY